MGIGDVGPKTCRSLVLLADRIRRWKDAVIYRAGFSNETGPLTLRLWDKPYNLAHALLRTLVSGQFPYKMMIIILWSCGALASDVEVHQAVTNE
jgi:hypothetical protein